MMMKRRHAAVVERAGSDTGEPISYAGLRIARTRRNYLWGLRRPHFIIAILALSFVLFEVWLYGEEQVMVNADLGSTKITTSTAAPKPHEKTKGSLEHLTTDEQEIIDLLGCSSSSPKTVKSASDLFCYAAMTQAEILENNCKASRKVILRLWKTLRQTVDDDPVLSIALSAASPTQRTLANHGNIQIWSPEKDKGVPQVIRELNDGEYGDFFPQLHSESLFVDAGSNLGFVTLLAALETNAIIVSFEAASPTWVMQQLNLVCNLPEQRLESIYSKFAALGSQDGSSIVLKWKEESTISVRGWDEPQSFVQNPLTIRSPVRSIRSVLKEIFGTTRLRSKPWIDVLKIDCEGCEYDVIPDLSEAEVNAIGTMIGEIHYGFIPTKNAPSTDRSRITHQRLCMHYNFVKFAKECCAFPNQTVRHLNITVSKVPGNADLCRDFDQWATEKKLFQVRDESGWLRVGKS